MGNCMETSKVRVEAERERKESTQEVREMECDKEQNGSVKDAEEKKGSGNKNNGVRVKMVLTKEELQWLMLQLNNREATGNKTLEEVLGEIEKGRSKKTVQQDHHAQGWRPSLDSISEVPEVIEMHRWH